METRNRIGSGMGVLLLALALGACGGDGDGDGGGAAAPANAGPPLPLTSANYTTAAKESVASALYLSSSTRLLLGAQVSSERMLLDALLATADRLPHWLGSRPKLVTGVTQTDSEPCDGGGRLDFTTDDLNGNDEADPGDRARVVAVNCVVNDVTANGAISAVFTATSGSFGTPPYSGTLAMTFDNFSAATTAAKAVGSGRFDLTASSSAVNRGSLAIDAATFTVVSTVGAASSTRTLSGFAIRADVSPSGAGTSTTVTASGTLSSSALDSMSVGVSTAQPFVTAAGARYPGSGQVVVAGAGGSKARLTARNTSTVLIELDANGDGTFEESKTMRWTDIV